MLANDATTENWKKMITGEGGAGGVIFNLGNNIPQRSLSIKDGCIISDPKFGS